MVVQGLAPSVDLACNGVLRSLPGCIAILCMFNTAQLHTVQGLVSAIQLGTCASSLLSPSRLKHLLHCGY